LSALGQRRRFEAKSKPPKVFIWSRGVWTNSAEPHGLDKSVSDHTPAIVENPRDRFTIIPFPVYLYDFRVSRYAVVDNVGNGGFERIAHAPQRADEGGS
jgi:hypothetical protein